MLLYGDDVISLKVDFFVKLDAREAQINYDPLSRHIPRDFLDHHFWA